MSFAATAAVEKASSGLSHVIEPPRQTTPAIKTGRQTLAKPIMTAARPGRLALCWEVLEMNWTTADWVWICCSKIKDRPLTSWHRYAWDAHARQEATWKGGTNFQQGFADSWLSRTWYNHRTSITEKFCCFWLEFLCKHFKRTFGWAQTRIL